jgi:hypothetical protein
MHPDGGGQSFDSRIPKSLSFFPGSAILEELIGLLYYLDNFVDFFLHCYS